MFTVQMQKDSLARALAYVCGTVERRNIIPILSGVLIALDDQGRVTLTATNLEQWVSERIDSVTVSPFATPGAVCIPAHSLKALVGEFPKGSIVTIREARAPHNIAGNVLINCSAGDGGSLESWDPADFPLGDADPPASEAVTFTVADIAKPLADALHTVSTEETRYYLNGVLWTVDQKRLTFVATDGHRMSVAKVADSAHVGPLPDTIMPTLGVRAFLRLCDVVDRTSVSVSKKYVVASNGARTLRTKLIDGSYPEWKRLIPKDGRTITVNRKALIKSVEACKKVSDGRWARLSFGDNVVIVSSGQYTGAPIMTTSGPSPLPAKGIAGFNSAYLAGVLRQLPGDAVAIMQPFEDGPWQFRHGLDLSPKFIIMPVTLDKV